MKRGMIVLILACMSLTACGRDAGQTVQLPASTRVKSTAPVKAPPTPDELTAGMVEAVTIGKSTVPVKVKFDLPEPPMVGRPVEVVIAVMPQISADRAVLAVDASAALTVASDAGGPIEISTVESDQVYRHNVKITPTVEGVQLLGLNVALRHDDVTESRIFSIPLIVAPKQ